MAAASPLRLVCSLSLTLAFPNIALGQAHPLPIEVWIHGSDIPTPEHFLTQRLQDALEAVIRVKPDASGAISETVIWLPEDVRIGRETFTYKAMLTDKHFHASRSSTGECDKDKLDDCAHAILRELIVNP
jgi:hypothetical protein